MIKFQAKTDKQTQELKDIVSSGSVGGLVQDKHTPKYFLYMPVTRRVREVSQFIYYHTFPEVEEIAFAEFRQMAGV